MARDLDLDIEEGIDPDFKKSIRGITSADFLEKMKYLNPLHHFKIGQSLTNLHVNMARFMMEGIGYSPKYWLCTGLETLKFIMTCNMDDEHYNDLIEQSGRKDVLCLQGLPLFYKTESELGDCLLLISDIKKENVRVCLFRFEEENKDEDDSEQTPRKMKDDIYS